MARGRLLQRRPLRKNFKTREEAAAEQSVLELKALNAANGLHTIATVLTAEQVREAEAVFHRLAGNAQPLSFYVDFAVANYRRPESHKLLADAVTEYVAAKEHELEQDHISPPQMERIRMDLKRLNTHFPRVTVAVITVAKVVEFLETGKPGMKTYNNRRGIVSTFFKFSFQRGWIAEPDSKGAAFPHPPPSRHGANLHYRASASSWITLKLSRAVAGCRISRSVCSLAFGPTCRTAK